MLMLNVQKVIKLTFVLVLITISYSMFVSQSGLVSAEHGGLHSCESDPNNPGECVGEATSHGPPVDEVEFTDVCDGRLPTPGPGTPDPELRGDNCDCDADQLNPDNCEIVKYLEIGINVMAGLAGLAIVGGIMTGGYMYMTARDNPGQTAAGRQRVVWALVALLILVFFWGFLQWLVPGGVL
jgi:hypothetical protein